MAHVVHEDLEARECSRSGGHGVKATVECCSGGGRREWGAWRSEGGLRRTIGLVSNDISLAKSHIRMVLRSELEDDTIGIALVGYCDCTSLDERTYRQ
jgi:hypothetical protein